LRWEFQRRLIVAIIAIIVISVILLSCSTKTAALSWRERIEREREDHAFWEKRCETKVIFSLSRRGIQLSFCGSMVPNEFDSDYGLKFNRFLRACLVS